MRVRFYENRPFVNGIKLARNVESICRGTFSFLNVKKSDSVECVWREIKILELHGQKTSFRQFHQALGELNNERINHVNGENMASCYVPGSGGKREATHGNKEI